MLTNTAFIWQKIHQKWLNIIRILKNSFLFEYILKCNLFLWCKAEFSSVSHDPSEIILICWFAAQETFIIKKNWKQLCCLIFLWKLCNLCIKVFINFKEITDP